MKITKLEKKKRLYLLELDESEKVYITEDTLVHFMLSKGKDLTDQQLSDLKDYNQFSLGKGLALYYISFRQRTSAEVSSYLHQHDISKEYIPQIIDQLTEQGLLDDEAYTKNYISEQAQYGDKGPYVITQKLRQKGIDRQLIDQYLEETDFSNSLERLTQKLLKKYEHKLPNKVLTNKLIENIMSKGFNYSQAQIAIDDLELEDDEEFELELLEKDLEKLYRKYERRYEDYQLKQKIYQGLLRKGYQSRHIQTILREYF